MYSVEHFFGVRMFSVEITLKWSSFQEKYSEELAAKAIAICKELHEYRQKYNGDAEKFCEFCFKGEGKYSFPCGEVREEFLKRFGKSLDSLL